MKNLFPDFIIVIVQITVVLTIPYLIESSIDFFQIPYVRSIAYFVVFWLIIILFGKAVRYLYRKTNRVDRGVRDNIYFGITNIERVLIGIGIIVTVFALLGIDPMSLLTSLSIVAAAIAIVLREYINDFLIGLYFSFSKNIEINDYVKIGDQKGKIQEISTFKVKLLNDDDDVVIVPNSKIYFNDIINYTKRNIRYMSVDFQIDITLVSDIEKFENELKKALTEYSEYIREDSYNLKIVEVAKDHVNFKFQYTIEKLDREIQQQIRRSTVRRVFSYITRKKSNKDVSGTSI